MHYSKLGAQMRGKAASMHSTFTSLSGPASGISGMLPNFVRRLGFVFRKRTLQRLQGAPKLPSPPSHSPLAGGGKPSRDSLAACFVHQLAPPTCLTVGRHNLSAAPSSSKLASWWGLSTIMGPCSTELGDALAVAQSRMHSTLQTLCRVA